MSKTERRQLGGRSQPSASVDKTLLDLLNSSYLIQPHSLIANFLKAQGFAGRRISNKTRIAKKAILTGLPRSDLF